MASKNELTDAKFIEEVTNCLKANEYSAAVAVFCDEAHRKHLKNDSWDLIPIFCKHVTAEERQKNEALAICCEKLMHKLALEACPEEGVLEFLYQLDETDHEKFRIVLESLKVLISRDTGQKLKSLEWTLNSIRSCMEQFIKDEKSEEFSIQGEDDAIQLTSYAMTDIVKFMNSITLFYEFFIMERDTNIDDDDNGDGGGAAAGCASVVYTSEEFDMLLSSRMLQMFDIVFPHTDLESCSELKSIQGRIQSLILNLIPNPMSLLEYVFYRALNVMKPTAKHKNLPKTIEEINRMTEENVSEQSSNDMNYNPFEDSVIISDLAYGMFFYSILCQTENEQIKIPMVYSPKYIMLSLIHVTTPFFESKTDITVNNGLVFLNLLLNRLNESLEKVDLYFSSHKSILIHLNNIMVYSQKEENRKLALTCFKKYISSFNWEARYYLLLRFRPHVTHPGSVGYLVVLLKEFVSQFLDVPQNSETYRKFNRFYRGKLLFDIIKQYCFLTNGPKTDLVENADHIISSLNALLYLIMRDKKNVTDIKRFIKKIQADFLNPLAEAIKSSRNYYQTKLKELQEPETSTGIGSSSELQLELSVKNESLPKLTPEQQKTAYESCINAVDLIELLLKRLIECFRDNELYPPFTGLFRLSGLRNRRLTTATTDQSDDSSTKEDQQYDSKIREKILSASLQFVSTHGWSKEAIANGAETLGYPGITNGLFSNGGADLINYFHVQCNQKLKDYMVEVATKSDHISEPKEFIRNSIEVRLRMLIPYIDKWPQAIAIMSLPPNVPVALANLLALSDDICYFAGDKSVDFNWYIRRVGVSGIYKVTELYMIQDKSSDYEQTWDFLERRLTEAIQIQQLITNGSEATMVAKDVASAVFTTARNILHLNDPR